MTRPSPADAFVAPPWRPDVTALDHYAAALADAVARHAAIGVLTPRTRDTARAYVAVCDAIDEAWHRYAVASRGAA